jgi:hypothetical protein
VQIQLVVARPPPLGAKEGARLLEEEGRATKQALGKQQAATAETATAEKTTAAQAEREARAAPLGAPTNAASWKAPKRPQARPNVW